jgi:hypothetical protein
MLVFTAGFVGGLLLTLLPARGSWADVNAPYWFALAIFVLHRVEEKQMGFFAYLSEVTGVARPAVASVPVILLVGHTIRLVIPDFMSSFRFRRSSGCPHQRGIGAVCAAT